VTVDGDGTDRIGVGMRAVPGFEPSYATAGSAGADLRAHIEHELVLRPGERRGVPTGIFLEIPSGMEGQVRPRSGLAIREGITVLNSPGTIDSDYRGEIVVPLINLGTEDVTILPGERIAQLVIAPVVQVSFESRGDLSPSDRGDGGFGSTGRS
jgi:dUTP pyrophosphatase